MNEVKIKFLDKMENPNVEEYGINFYDIFGRFPVKIRLGFRIARWQAGDECFFMYAPSTVSAQYTILKGPSTYCCLRL